MTGEVIWREHDNRGLVCQLPGDLSSDAFQRVRRVFAQQVGAQFGNSVTAITDARLIIVNPVTPWLAHPGSIHRQWLTNQIRLALNGSAK